MTYQVGLYGHNKQWIITPLILGFKSFVGEEDRLLLYSSELFNCGNWIIKSPFPFFSFQNDTLMIWWGLQIPYLIHSLHQDWKGSIHFRHWGRYSMHFIFSCIFFIHQSLSLRNFLQVPTFNAWSVEDFSKKIVKSSIFSKFLPNFFFFFFVSRSYQTLNS